MFLLQQLPGWSSSCVQASWLAAVHSRDVIISVWFVYMGIFEETATMRNFPSPPESPVPAWLPSFFGVRVFAPHVNTSNSHRLEALLHIWFQYAPYFSKSWCHRCDLFGVLRIRIKMNWVFKKFIFISVLWDGPQGVQHLIRKIYGPLAGQDRQRILNYLASPLCPWTLHSIFLNMCYRIVINEHLSRPGMYKSPRVV